MIYSIWESEAWLEKPLEGTKTAPVLASTSSAQVFVFAHLSLLFSTPWTLAALSMDLTRFQQLQDGQQVRQILQRPSISAGQA